MSGFTESTADLMNIRQQEKVEFFDEILAKHVFQNQPDVPIKNH